ncbi:M48 family metallopeptidase [bacterium]|nr:M48 family metallopeptidase [bacterium]
MWEAIESNRRKSWILILALGLLLGILGAAIGSYFFPGASPRNGLPLEGMIAGGLIAGILWLILLITAFSAGDHILLASSGAREVTKADAPQLVNVIEEMTIASGMPRPPKTYIIENDSPNAFAVGRKPETASVAVTSGLLRKLSRDELQGVIAHEIGHIRNLDVRFMTLAAVSVSAIVILSDVFLRSMFYGGGRRTSRRRNSQGGAAGAIFLIIGLLVAILAPILAHLLYMASSRRREYLADASSARYTRYPEGLASALEKIALAGKQSTRKENNPQRGKVNRAIAPLYTVNPLQAAGGVGLFSTHPPTEKRIQILRSMAGGAGYVNYDRAFRKVTGDGCIGSRTLSADEPVLQREATSEEEDQTEKLDRSRKTLDFLDGLAGFHLIPCACGMRIKIPPTYDKPEILCPRCGRNHDISGESPGKPGQAPTAVADALAEQSRAPIQHLRRGQGWKSLKCPCGHHFQISPTFGGRSLTCPECGQKFEIANTS